MADHRARYKNTGLDSKELRRRREEDSSQLRKQKRDDVLSKRRTIETCENLGEDDSKIEDIESVDLRNDFILEIDKSVVDALTQNDDQQLLIDTAQKVRKLLSKEPEPPFQQVIDSGLVPRFVELLDRHDDTTLQFEVAWILTNICSGTSQQTRVVVTSEAIPKLVALLNSPDTRVREQSVWALGNITGDCAEFRDIVISHGFIPALLSLIRPDIDINFLRNVTWVLVNLCRNKEPPPSHEIIKQLLPALAYLTQLQDLPILIDTTWAVSYITELGPNFSQLVIDFGLVERMVPLLAHKELKIQTAAIRALGSIVTGNEHQTQSVIDAGALPRIKQILHESRNRIVNEALWFVSNIAAGTTDQIQDIIDNQLIPPIINYLEHGEFQQQKEAAWVIYNLSLSCGAKQLTILVDENVIKPLCNLLTLKDPSVVRNVLESIQIILNLCHEDNPHLVDQIEACGGLDKIEMLQNDENSEIYNFAYTIISRYFSGES